MICIKKINPLEIYGPLQDFNVVRASKQKYDLHQTNKPLDCRSVRNIQMVPYQTKRIRTMLIQVKLVRVWRRGRESQIWNKRSNVSRQRRFVAEHVISRRTLSRSQPVPTHIWSQLLLGNRLKGSVPARCSITPCSYMRCDTTSGILF